MEFGAGQLSELGLGQGVDGVALGVHGKAIHEGELFHLLQRIAIVEVTGDKIVGAGDLGIVEVLLAGGFGQILEDVVEAGILDDEAFVFRGSGNFTFTTADIHRLLVARSGLNRLDGGATGRLTGLNRFNRRTAGGLGWIACSRLLRCRGLAGVFLVLLSLFELINEVQGSTSGLGLKWCDEHACDEDHDGFGGFHGIGGLWCKGNQGWGAKAVLCLFRNVSGWAGYGVLWID